MVFQIGRASCRERGVDLGGRRIIKKKTNNIMLCLAPKTKHMSNH